MTSPLDDMGDEPDTSDGPSEEFLSAFREYQSMEDDEGADPDDVAQAFWAAVKACVSGGYDEGEAEPAPKKEPKLALIFGKGK